MNDIFNFFNPLSFAKRGVSKYNPLINYNWSIVTTSGLRYLKDVGSTPTYNAAMYFGKGAYFNGVDQNISIPVSVDRGAGTSVCAFISDSSLSSLGYVVVANTSTAHIVQYNGAYSIYDVSTGYYKQLFYPTKNFHHVCVTQEGSVGKLYIDGIFIDSTELSNSSNPNTLSLMGTQFGFVSGILKDLYYFNKVLTDDEINKAYSKPEEFYSFANNDTECLVNMPMCENDECVRNMKKYILAEELIYNGSFENGLDGWNDSSAAILSIFEGKCKIETNEGDSAGAITKSIENLIPGKGYVLKYSAQSPANGGGIGVKISSDGGNWDLYNGSYVAETTLKSKSAFFVATTSTINIYLYSTGLGVNGQFALYDNVSLKESDSFYEISNYTSSVRDNAKNLEYGLQTCKFARDELGVIQNLSDYLECDNNGYASIEWYPTIDDRFSIEIICELSDVNAFQLHGSTYSGGIFVGQNSGGKRAYVRVFNSPTYTVATNDIPLISFTYDPENKNVNIYINGEFSGQSVAVSSTNIVPFLLGRTYPNSYYFWKPVRLFKVHEKILTQEEITNNYNSYLAKGLLS